VKTTQTYYNVFLLTIAFFEIITLSTNKLRWCSKKSRYSNDNKTDMATQKLEFIWENALRIWELL